MEHMETRKTLCVHRPKTLNASNVQGHEVLKDCIQCLCSNLVYRLFMRTNQPINDRRANMLSLDNYQQDLIQHPTMH